LSDQTHPDDGDTLTQTEISLAETMQRDGAQRSERGVYQVDTLWNQDGYREPEPRLAPRAPPRSTREA
jgi:hypothetical protein